MSREAWGQAPVSMFFATVGGIGHIPGGPGTYAGALAVPLVWVTMGWPLWLKVGLLVVVTALSILWCDVAERVLGEPDSRKIVLDEFVGTWATLVWFGALVWPAAVVGFVAFRILDVIKPPPANMIHGGPTGGFHIMVDDLIAAVWAVPFAWAVQWFFG